MLQKQIETALGTYQVPYLDKNLLQVKAIKQIEVTDKKVTISIVLGFPILGIKNTLLTDLKALIQPLTGDLMLDIQLSFHIDAHVGKQGLTGLPNVKNIIAVASGKGGVGKSTVSVNLALALAQDGARVGMLDADIYGPSQPTMLGAEGQKPIIEERTLLPVERHGIQSMSIGYLVNTTDAMVWRGPMLGKAMQQLIHDTRWDNLDYLIVDLPPGTGDVQLTLCQKIPVSGTVIVTTPQDLALLDVARACEMFNKLNVPLLGVVENMSSYHCSNCGHEERIFGKGGGEKLSQQYAMPMLGAIPLDIHIRELTDSGVPPVVQAPDNHYAKAFFNVARKVAAALSLQTKDYSAKFPKVVVKQEKREE